MEIRQNKYTENLFSGIYSYRILFIIASIAYVVFPFILKNNEPSSYDPMWGRIAVSSLIMSTYILSFFSQNVKKNIVLYVYFLSYIITFHYQYLMYMNNMSIGYAIGYFTIAPCTTVLFKNVKSLILYITLSLLGILFIFYSLPEPIINFSIFISILITINVIMFLVVISRIILINRSNKNNYQLTKSNFRLNNAIETINLFNSKLKQQKEEIIAQRNLIEEKNAHLKKTSNIIKQKNKDVTDSISYAQRIQSALLPSENYIDNILNDYFILFKPKDIVSGDFYWIKQKKEKIIIAAADCTGHGVPGAFMSILGITILNDITDKYNLNANEILNHLRQDIIDVLYKYSDSLNTRDGMDIALYIINNKTKILQFAGAYNPLYLIRNNQFYKYKADKMQIGIPRSSLSSFLNQEIAIQKNDSIYIFSDGYIDQFGKFDKEKFKTKRFQKLLVSINEMPMNEQKNVLNNTIETWKGEVEQTDDILVVGVKI